MSADIFDDKQAKFIELIIDGKSWRAARAELKIGNGTISNWLQTDEAFRERYARATEIRADALFEEIIDIADDGSNDFMERNHAGSVCWVENGETIRRSALRIDARKWVAGKLKPKVYGDKATLEHTGEVVTKVVRAAPMSPDEWAKRHSANE